MKRIILFLGVSGISLFCKGQGLNFDGVDDYVIASNVGPLGSTDRTVECWIRTSNSISSQTVIIDWGAMSPSGSRFTLNLINNGRLRIEIGGNGITGTTQVANGVWHHVAVTYDHSATTKVRMYIDGIQEFARNFTVGVNTASTNAIQLGRRNDGVNFYQGEMDEVRIWDVVRTAAEISANMNLEYCSPQTGLVAYYQLNDGMPSGMNSTITSASELISANNGTLTNFTLSGSTSNWVNGNSSISIPINDSIVQVGSTIVAIDSTMNTYIWIDCNSATPLISNRAQSYTPIVNGDYQVVLQKGSCVDTSTCLNFLSVGVNQVQLLETIASFPNPVQNYFNINLPDTYLSKKSIVSIYTINGKLVSEFSPSNSNQIKLDVSKFENGAYLVQIISGSNMVVKKMLVQH